MGPWADTFPIPIDIRRSLDPKQWLPRGTLRLERLAGDDQLDEGGEAVFAGAEGGHQGVRGVGVAAGERPTQGIGHDLACHRLAESRPDLERINSSRSSLRPLTLAPSGNSDSAAIGCSVRFSRRAAPLPSRCQFPTASYSSNAIPQGSILRWQLLQDA